MVTVTTVAYPDAVVPVIRYCPAPPIESAASDHVTVSRSTDPSLYVTVTVGGSVICHRRAKVTDGVLDARHRKRCDSARADVADASQRLEWNPVVVEQRLVVPA